MTEQELGLHLIARYLLTPDKCLPNVDHLVRKLCYAYSIPRIDNISTSGCGAYICWALHVCGNCKRVYNLQGSSLYGASCSNCSSVSRIICYHSALKMEKINADITFISYEYKLKLQEILWQTYLRRLL